MPTPHVSDRELIIRTLHERGLGEFEAQVLELAQPTVQFKTRRDRVPVGKSKFGGQPDLPVSEEWPARRGIPFSFIGQLDLAEVGRYLPDSPLPDRGLLLFFFDTSDFYVGRDCCRVIHARGPVARRPAPNASDLVFLQFRECALELVPSTSVPDFSTAGSFDDATRSALQDWSAVAQEALERFGKRHELLGYPRKIQSVDPGVELSRLDATTTLRQLMAFDADEEAEMPWVDLGTLWFFIDVSDLARHDFSRVASIVQFH